jgi:acetylornithine deacetylase/succinyl-diaminopimelate desuccinylase-like protein
MDDKGPTVAALYSLLAIKESAVKLNRRIRLFFGLSDENGGNDIRYYVENGGEIPVMGFTPDGEYPVIHGEKGFIIEHYKYKCNCTNTFNNFVRIIASYIKDLKTTKEHTQQNKCQQHRHT